MGKVKQPQKGKKFPVKRTEAFKIPAGFYALLPLVVTALFFIPVAGFDVLNWDDGEYLTNNPLLKDFSLYRLFTLFWMGNYHPLTMLLFTAGMKIAGANGTFFHLLSLAFHLLNVYLVYRVVMELTGKNRLVAMLTALLFGIHPMHIGSVTWISELKDMSYAAFFLLSLFAYLRYAARGKWTLYAASLLLFLLSCLCKGQAVVLAPVIILADILKKRKFTLPVIAEKIPFLALALCFGLLAMKAQQSVSALSFGMVKTHENYLFAFYNYAVYLLKAVYPWGLAPVHPYPALSTTVLLAIMGLFLALAAASVWVARKTGPLTVFGLLFFAVTLSIVAKFIPVGEESIAERYTYIPYIGLFLLMAMAFARLLKNPRYRIAGAVILAAYLTGLLIRGYGYLGTYRNSETYWQNEISVHPGFWRPYYNLCKYYGETGQPEKALEMNTRAIDLIPSDYRSERVNLYLNRGSIYVNNTRDYARGLEDYRIILTLDTTMSKVYFYEGLCCNNLGRKEEAVRALNHCLALDPGNTQAMYVLSFAESSFGRYREAIDHLDKAIRIDPGYLDAYYQRALICTESLEDHEKALYDFTFLVGRGYKLQDVYLNLAVCCLRLGRTEEVFDYCDKGINAGGDRGKAFFLKALASEKLRRMADAYRFGEEAIRAGTPVDPSLMNRWKPR